MNNMLERISKTNTKNFSKDNNNNVEELYLKGIGKDGVPIYGSEQFSKYIKDKSKETKNVKFSEIADFVKFTWENYDSPEGLLMIENMYYNLVGRGMDKKKLLSFVENKLISGYVKFVKENSDDLIRFSDIQKMFRKLISMGIDKDKLNLKNLL